MAAGMGSRYDGLKQFDPVGPSGETLMAYAVFDAIRAGVGRVVFVIRQEDERTLKRQISDKLVGRVEVVHVFQSIDDLPAGFSVPDGRDKPWGTAHALWSTRDAVKTSFMVQNADDFYGTQTYDVMMSALRGVDPNSRVGFNAGYPLRGTLSEHGPVSRAVLRSTDGWLKELVERHNIVENPGGALKYLEGDRASGLSGDELCSMNFWGFTPAVFDVLGASFTAFLGTESRQSTAEWLIPQVVSDSIARGQLSVRVLRTDEPWIGMTYPEDRDAVVARIDALVSERRYPSPLF
jgi:NDP-sugar pyrophosphorylase family protein